MGFFNKKSKALEAELQAIKTQLEDRNKPSAVFTHFQGNTVLFDGEKTPNELGSAYDYDLDYNTLRMRGWEALIKSTVVQTAIKQYCLWIVGSGLKFQSTASEDFLSEVGIKFDKKKFSKNVEARFRLFANSKQSTCKKEMNLHALVFDALMNAIIAGDVLWIARYDGYQPSFDIIDGCFIMNPPSLESVPIGNTVRYGVEKSKNGIVVAYHVRNDDYTFTRVQCNPNGKAGSRQAWLMKGTRYKINSDRGMSLLTAVLERDAKLDRFIEATVGAAEENAKIPYQITHSQYSNGEDPMIQNAAQAMGLKKANTVNETATAEAYASKIQQTTGKMTFNMPVGAEIKTNTNHSDPNFKDFYTPNAEFIYSTIGIPPEVALSKYGGTYSGSRAAQKSWEYKMLVERSSCISEFGYKPCYEYWFTINLYKNNIDAPGCRQAIIDGDWLVKNAYMDCKFIGQKVPHIDPVKEANAVRILLGKKYETIPLISGEQACENMNTGDFDEVQKVAESEVESSYFYEEVEESEPKKDDLESKVDNILDFLENN